MLREMPDKIAVGARLARLRDALDMNQTEFAKHLSIAQNRLSQYETGDRLIPVNVATVVASRTGVTLDWIYNGEGSSLPMRLNALIGLASETRTQ